MSWPTTKSKICNNNGVTMLIYTEALAKTKMLVHTNERLSKVPEVNVILL